MSVETTSDSEVLAAARRAWEEAWKVKALRDPSGTPNPAWTRAGPSQKEDGVLLDPCGGFGLAGHSARRAYGEGWAEGSCFGAHWSITHTLASHSEPPKCFPFARASAKGKLKPMFCFPNRKRFPTTPSNSKKTSQDRASERKKCRQG